MRTYQADVVDALLADTYKLAEDAMGVASRKEAECNQLLTDKVELEKVAALAKSAKAATTLAPVLDPKQLDDCLDTLQDLAILDAKGREKIASAIIADPNKAFDLILKVATSSQAAPEQGSGLAKTASRRATTEGSQDPDGWGTVTPEAP